MKLKELYQTINLLSNKPKSLIDEMRVLCVDNKVYFGLNEQICVNVSNMPNFYLPFSKFKILTQNSKSDRLVYDDDYNTIHAFDNPDVMIEYIHNEDDYINDNYKIKLNDINDNIFEYFNLNCKYIPKLNTFVSNDFVNPNISSLHINKEDILGTNGHIFNYQDINIPELTKHIRIDKVYSTSLSNIINKHNISNVKVGVSYENNKAIFYFNNMTYICDITILDDEKYFNYKSVIFDEFNPSYEFLIVSNDIKEAIAKIKSLKCYNEYLEFKLQNNNIINLSFDDNDFNFHFSKDIPVTSRKLNDNLGDLEEPYIYKLNLNYLNTIMQSSGSTITLYACYDEKNKIENYFSNIVFFKSYELPYMSGIMKIQR